MSHTERDASCEVRLPAHLAGREEWADLWYFDLESADPEDVIALARRGEREGYGIEFELTPKELELVQLWKDGAPLPGEPECAEEWPDDQLEEPSTKEAVYDDIAERAKEAMEQFRENSPEPDVLAVSATVTVELRVELSTGGPADFITADLDPEDRSIDNVQYHFQDWFDGAKRGLDSDSALYRMAESFAQVVGIEGMGDQ